VEEDHGSFFVGKLFDRPLRSQAEERTFIYGEVFEDSPAAAQAGQQVMLDWAPGGVSSYIASKYLRSLPDGHVSIQGSEGAVRRKKQLEKQFPLHDVEPGQCHQLSQGEMESMSSYVENVKRNVAGQGVIQELGDENCSNHRNLHADAYHHEKPQEQGERNTPSPPPSQPPPPMSLLNTNTLSYTLAGTHLNNRPPKLENSSTSATLQTTPNKPRHFLSPHLYQNIRKGSTGSSIASSPSPPPLSPTPSTWFCSGCDGQMNPGEIAIFAERAGHNKCWHSNCFSCTQCGEMLEDLLYFYNNGKLFCGRDFANLMKIPRCSACDELIFCPQYTFAEDRFWHEDHFCCWICDVALAGHEYIPVDGQPHCLACWQERHGKVCSACGDCIHPQAQRVELGEEQWHATGKCFKCGVCGDSLMGGKVSRRRGLLVCSKECGEKVESRTVGVQDQGRIRYESKGEKKSKHKQDCTSVQKNSFSPSTSSINKNGFPAAKYLQRTDGSTCTDPAYTGYSTIV